jgi:hypothetical protein
MTELVELVARGVLMGVAGSAFMDLWSLVLRRGFGIPTLDYRFLGRWIGHMPRGTLVHAGIAASPPVRGERTLGWAAHYAIGVTFAFLLVAIAGRGWLHSPTVWPALAVGLGTIVAPWFVMQPAMGMGVAASRSGTPAATRLRNVGTHAMYGLGLYASAVAMSVAT